MGCDAKQSSHLSHTHATPCVFIALRDAVCSVTGCQVLLCAPFYDIMDDINTLAAVLATFDLEKLDRFLLRYPPSGQVIAARRLQVRFPGSPGNLPECPHVLLRLWRFSVLRRLSGPGGLKQAEGGY